MMDVLIKILKVLLQYMPRLLRREKSTWGFSSNEISVLWNCQSNLRYYFVFWLCRLDRYYHLLYAHRYPYSNNIITNDFLRFKCFVMVSLQMIDSSLKIQITWISLSNSSIKRYGNFEMIIEWVKKHIKLSRKSYTRAWSLNWLTWYNMTDDERNKILEDIHQKTRWFHGSTICWTNSNAFNQEIDRFRMYKKRIILMHHFIWYG